MKKSVRSCVVFFVIILSVPLADGGDIALTAESDQYTTAKWSGMLGARDLDAIKVTDFEMVDAGQRISYTGNCLR